MRAVILAAGFGTRLWPLTADRTKPAIPFLNRPLISYCVQYLVEHRIHEIIINLHHQPESIRDALGSGSRYGAEIEYSYEEEILGTSGALDRVRDRLIGDDFVVINGKIITTMNLRAAIQHHRDRKALTTLVLRPNPARERFSTVEVDANGWIKEFGPHPTPLAPARGSEESCGKPLYGCPGAGAVVALPAPSAGGPSPGMAPLGSPASAAIDDRTPLMFTGIQVLSPRIFEYIPRGVFSHSTVHVYPRAIEAGEAVIGYVSDDDWYEMSTLNRYLEASMALERKALPPGSEEPAIMGKDCIIEAGADVRNSVLWERVVVEAGARVDCSVIGDGVRIPSGANICRAAVVRRDAVRNIERGMVVGDNLIVPID
jgi:NDP-sugar pyrophosphorylase family protein